MARLRKVATDFEDDVDEFDDFDLDIPVEIDNSPVSESDKLDIDSFVESPVVVPKELDIARMTQDLYSNSDEKITRESIAAARKMLEEERVRKAIKAEQFDYEGVLKRGQFEDVLLFGSLDCYRDGASVGLVLDGNKLGNQNRAQLVSGICRLHITIEGRVTQGEHSQGFLKRKELDLHAKHRIDDRLSGFIGFEDERQRELDTEYFEIAYADCDLLFDTGHDGVELNEMYNLIGQFTSDDEEMILDLAAVDLVKKYKENYVNACCMAIARLYVHPSFRRLGLSCWLLRNLPALGQTVVNKPVGDMLLIPGDFSGEALRRNTTKKEYTKWLKNYYEKNGFKESKGELTRGVFRNRRLSL